MKESFRLSVSKPCEENWDRFVPAGAGRHCHSCNKVVTDFTKMGDAEIIDFFKNRPSHICGRFTNDQLKQYAWTRTARVKPGTALLRAGMAGVFLLLVARTAVAQEHGVKPATEVAPTARQQNDHHVSKERKVVEGVVRDPSGEVMPGANVVLKGTTTGTISDVNGQFRFPEALGEGDVLVFSFIGFETKEYKIRNEDLEQSQLVVQVDLALCEYISMGEVAIDGVYEPHRSVPAKWWSAVKAWF